MSTTEKNAETTHDADDDGRHKTSKTSSSSSSHPSRSRRKISMPWFRQSSFGMSLARLRLPKQHTIATELMPDEKQNSGSDRDPDVSCRELKL
jgi:hypothetical protein